MPFVEALNDLAKSKNAKVKFCQVGSEFQKIFAASPLANIEICENEDKAIESLQRVLLTDQQA